MTGLQVRPLGDNYGWGSIVGGVTWGSIKDADTRAELAALFEDRGFIIFEDVEPDSHMQVALSEVFGPLKDHPTKNQKRAGAELAEGVIDMHYPPLEDNGRYHGLVEVDGTILKSFSPWHFDHCYNDELNRAGVLRSVITAPEMGGTGFADGIELYKAFSPELLKQIENLNVIYTLDVRLTQMRFGRTFKTFGDTARMGANLLEAATFPRAMHPAVWTRPTGEKVLHLAGWMAVGIEGHEDPEGEALLEEACQEVNRKVNAYWHDWKPTEMLIWDNWRMLHAVEGCPPQYERQVHRTTIKGDYGLGYFEEGKRPGQVQRELAPLLLD